MSENTTPTEPAHAAAEQAATPEALAHAASEPTSGAASAETAHAGAEQAATPEVPAHTTAEPAQAATPVAPTNSVVIYNSVTGFSRTYGRWVADAIGAQLVSWDQARTMPLSGYDLIVYGAGVRMSVIRGFSAFRRKLVKEGLHGSGKVLVWANGGTPQHPDRDWKVPASTFTKTELARDLFPFVYVEGGVRYEGLNPVEAGLLRVFSKRVQRYRGRGEWAVAVADGIAQGYDHSSREQIEPLIAVARERLGM